MTTGSASKVWPSLDDIIAAIESDEYLGFCLSCGAQASECEPDAREYVCEECGAPDVYGAQECMLMVQA